MTTVDWYFDFISPFAYLQFMQLDRIPTRIRITPKPILFAGLLNHWGHKGPAEIPSKRIFTYRHMIWLAKQQGIPLVCPPAHPFNPLKALRLAVALGGAQQGLHTIFHHIWAEGCSLEGADWQTLQRKLGVDGDRLIQDPTVKQQLLDNGNKAIAAGVFGVPTLMINEQLFWGHDATGMFLDYLQNPNMFRNDPYNKADTIPIGSTRMA